MSGFRDEQIQSLRDLLDVQHVRTKTVNGTELSYIEGWFTIAEANRIFGYDGWDRETVHFACVWQGKSSGQFACNYIAKVRVTVRAGESRITREGTGSGAGTGVTPGDAHEKALKEAETDAMKRALATFGNRFGLALYDKEQRGIRRESEQKTAATEQWYVRSARSDTSTICHSVTEFYSELKRELQETKDIESVRALWNANEPGLKAAREAYPGLEDRNGNHYSVVFNRLCKRRIAALREISESSSTEPEGEPGRIDKSQLQIGVPRRIRDRDHLRSVARNPCLVCGRSPAQAHHLSFMQPRARGLKVSDEWTVPLCAIHHRELHDRGNEKMYWEEKRINPVEVAVFLWAQHRRSPEVTGALHQPSPSF